jgi:hypothetical protein
LSTLSLIAKKCEVSPGQWIELLIGWIRAEIGEENFSLLNVKPATLPWASGAKPKAEALFSELFASLSSHDQRQIIVAMIRKPVLSGLPGLNRAVELQRDEMRQYFSGVLAKRLTGKRALTEAQLSGLMLELQQRGLCDVTINPSSLSEHDLRQSWETLAHDLLSDVIGNPVRRLRERSKKAIEVPIDPPPDLRVGH